LMSHCMKAICSLLLWHSSELKLISASTSSIWLFSCKISSSRALLFELVSLNCSSSLSPTCFASKRKVLNLWVSS
jgi:hypothetical protein